jgi:hypothetical protein
VLYAERKDWNDDAICVGLGVLRNACVAHHVAACLGDGSDQGVCDSHGLIVRVFPYFRALIL